MWTVTVDGFFDCVSGQKFLHGFEESMRGHMMRDYVVVRSRDKGSLSDLKARLLWKNGTGDPESWPWDSWTGKVWTSEDDGVVSDYPHRMLLPKTLWKEYLALCVDELNYPRFKAAMAWVWRDGYGLDIADRRSAALIDAWAAFKYGWPDEEPVTHS